MTSLRALQSFEYSRFGEDERGENEEIKVWGRKTDGDMRGGGGGGLGVCRRQWPERDQDNDADGECAPGSASLSCLSGFDTWRILRIVWPFFFYFFFFPFL